MEIGVIHKSHKCSFLQEPLVINHVTLQMMVICMAILIPLAYALGRNLAQRVPVASKFYLSLLLLAFMVL